MPLGMNRLGRPTRPSVDKPGAIGSIIKVVGSPKGALGANQLNMLTKARALGIDHVIVLVNNDR